HAQSIHSRRDSVYVDAQEGLEGWEGMNFELFVALRYLLAKRRQAFISVISLISILGWTVGVMGLLIALALMTGLQGELRDRIVGSSAHVYVFKVGEGIRDVPGEIAKMKQLPHVIGAAPATIGKGLLTAGPNLQAPVTIKGIDPALQGSSTDIPKALRSGSRYSVRPPPGEIGRVGLGTPTPAPL